MKLPVLIATRISRALSCSFGGFLNQGSGVRRGDFSARPFSDARHYDQLGAFYSIAYSEGSVGTCRVVEASQSLTWYSHMVESQ
jgi:hypothetical protein